MAIDVEALLKPVAPDNPCGVNLDTIFDPDYTEVVQIVSGSGEGMVVDDSSENGAAREPDWRDVRARCLKLMSRTKDVRVVNYLTLSLLQLEGLEGLRDGLKLQREMLSRYWENVYPQLDRTDNNDPTKRMNALGALSPAGTRGDTMRFRDRLRETPLAISNRVGKYGMLHIDLADGRVQPVDPAASRPDKKVIESAFGDTNPEVLKALAAAAGEAKDHLSALEQFLAEKVGNESAPNLQAFDSALKEVHSQLQRHVGTGGDTGTKITPGPDERGGQGNDAGRPMPQRLNGEISSGDDVLEALKKISRYYEQNEKSSPVPLFVDAAKQMISKSYLEIHEKLTPDAVAQLRAIAAEPEKTE
jgi:type VI secretion system protein ImpA